MHRLDYMFCVFCIDQIRVQIIYRNLQVLRMINLIVK